MEAPKSFPTVAGSPSERLGQMSRFYVLSRAIHAVARLGLANRVADTPVRVAELARAEGLHPAFLARVMRYLASYDIFEETSSGCFRATELSRLMRDDHPRSMAPVLRMVSDPWWNAAGCLAETIRTGRSGMELQNGQRFFDFLAAHPDLQRDFDDGMSRFSQVDDETLAKAYDFSKAASVVDLAGGKGNFLREVLRHNLHLEGILFERPAALSDPVLLADFVKAGRARLVPGNLFEVLPAPADVYVLKGTLHDFADDDVLAILGNCVRAMGRTDRLLLIEQLLPTTRAPHPNKTMDMVMMFLLGGEQRTLEQWQDLFARSALRLIREIPTPTSYTILEATRHTGP